MYVAQCKWANGAGHAINSEIALESFRHQNCLFALLAAFNSEWDMYAASLCGPVTVHKTIFSQSHHWQPVSTSSSRCQNMHNGIKLISNNKAQIICGYLYLEFNVHSLRQLICFWWWALSLVDILNVLSGIRNLLIFMYCIYCPACLQIAFRAVYKRGMAMYSK